MMHGSDLENEMSENHRFRIDDACQGHGRCYVLAPKWFDQDENGQGEVRDILISQEEFAEASEMLQACPEDAVQLEQL
jgi:ferredoxin